jgi:tetratricopeptide (TPR) repeat protein
MAKSVLYLLFLLSMSTIAFAQQKEQAEKLVDEGIALHDKGDYAGAIERYDKALELDHDNLLALAEKAFSLVSLQKYDESITYCKRAIEKHRGEKNLASTYVTYGNALDMLKQTDQAIAIYDEGIAEFPGNYQLYFNKGVTVSSINKYDEAIICFQKAVTIKPTHPGSHNGMARLLKSQGKRIPAILAFSRFLMVEPQSARASENLTSIQSLMSANVEETGKNSVTINISSDVLSDTKAGAKPKENSFNSADVVLSMAAALDFDKKNKKKSDVERFIQKFETLCATLSETRKDNFGFYWNYYVPYFTEMKDKDYLTTFAYIAFASSGDPKVEEWLNGHKDEIEKFYNWSKNFNWSSK